MSLADLVRSGVAIANGITADLQPTVTHEAFTGVNVSMEETYGAAVTRHAVVEMKPRYVKNQDGIEVLTNCTLQFTVPVTVKPGDRFTIDGQKRKCVATNGVMDPSTLQPYASEAYLGEA